jgi:diguanylate cyclase (GGDEF)-like protein/PAS domain S-box-containing protein
MSGPATILIVDDEIHNRKLLEALLRPEGYLTVSVANGEEALASVAERAPDLILLDIMMPGMDGYQVTSALKADPATAHIPIIMVTASIGRESRLAGLTAGAEDFLNKPVDRGELWLRVRNLLRLKTLGDFLKNHSVILEKQVQERTAELNRFRSAMEISGDSIVLVDRASLRYIDVNQTLCNLVGRTRQELIGMTPMDLFSAKRETLELDYDALIADNNSSPGKVEGQYRHKNGSLIPIETRRRALQTDQGWIIVCTTSDITDRRAAEAKIHRLNRVYAVLSAINMLIVRVRDRDELFKEACEIAVGHGQFRMAWIGHVDHTAMKIVPIASAGSETGLLDDVGGRMSLRDDAPQGHGPPAIAVMEKRAVVVNDVENDPRIGFRSAHAVRGIRSLVILPLLVAGEPVAVLGLHAGDAGFFDDAEMKLLTELAGDIAFAIDNIDKQARVDYLAYYDVLTGLANRRLFLERVGQYMRSAASGGHQLAVFLVDLERFKNINDSLGQTAGDELLRQVAQWLTLYAGDATLIARLGADHFALVLPEVTQESGVARLLEKTIAAFLEHPFRMDDAVFRIAAKVGVAIFPDHCNDADSLLKNAEAALKKAKARGERYLFYTSKMTETVAGTLTLENQLRQALDKGEFVLHYQPKVNLESGAITSAEALIRWNDPQTGLVPPGRFIPILEETGLINEVGRWALRQALKDYLLWRNAGLAAVRIAVNVSPLQLRNRKFIDEIQQVIGVDALAADGLELEITESLIMEDVKHSIATLKEIRAMGVTVAIDDFGTGFSSLSHLARLPVDTLKIDRSFVTDMTAGPEGLALVSTVISLAHSLKLEVVAEGVETEEQSRLLRLLGCDEMQGFLFSRPVPGGVFQTAFLAPVVAPLFNPLATTARGIRQRVLS